MLRDLFPSQLLCFSICRAPGSVVGDPTSGGSAPYYGDAWDEEAEDSTRGVANSATGRFRCEDEGNVDGAGLAHGGHYDASPPGLPIGGAGGGAGFWARLDQLPVLPPPQRHRDKGARKQEDNDDFAEADVAADVSEFQGGAESSEHQAGASEQALHNRVKASSTHRSFPRPLGGAGAAGMRCHRHPGYPAGFATMDSYGAESSASGSAAATFGDASDSSAVFSMQWRGCCGFVVRLRPDTPEGPWLCHHFTLDGAHCVQSGLGKQFANRCAGALHPIDGEATSFDDITTRRRCMGLHKPDMGMGYPLLLRCARPPSTPLCRPDTCPYLAQHVTCPYAARIAEAASAAAEQRVSDSASCTTAPTSDEWSPNGAAVQPEPDGDSDFSPIHSPRHHVELPALGPLMEPGEAEEEAAEAGKTIQNASAW